MIPSRNQGGTVKADSKTCRQPLCSNRSTLAKCIGTCLYMAYFYYVMARYLHSKSLGLDQHFWVLVGLTFLGLGTATVKASSAICKHYLANLIGRLRTGANFIRRLILTKFQRLPLIVVCLSCLLFVIIDASLVRHEFFSLVSVAGLVVILAACWLLSSARRQIKARQVVVGLALQFAFGVFILRVRLGVVFFGWLGNMVVKLLACGNEGAKFVWPSMFQGGNFAFAILPIIPFFAALTTVLEHLGWLQKLVQLLARFMETLMGTTAGESTTCSANVFLGMTEAPLLVKPLLPHMTLSELHAVLTGGFATIAGVLMAAFISLNINPQYLLAASLMAAPGSLALSKLCCPEIEETKLHAKDVADKFKSAGGKNLGRAKTVIEAACQGAAISIPMVTTITANLTVAIALLAFCNKVLVWFGDRAGLTAQLTEQPFNLEFLASYLFWPFALLIGTPLADCRPVAMLLGVKLFTNEFVAYMRLVEMMNARQTYESYFCKFSYSDLESQTLPMINMSSVLAHESFLVKFNGGSTNPILLASGSFYLPATNTTVPPFISRRAEALATYALCGFANFVSVGIQIGTLGQLAPSQKERIARVALRAMLTATGVNLINAAIAGMLLGHEDPGWRMICVEQKQTALI